MIGRLTGRLIEDAADGGLVLDVGGVGYEITAPLGTGGRATPDAAGLVTLFVHTHVREDAFLLYGFATRDDREAFRSLIAVSNVGPRMAVSLLSALSASELARAIEAGDGKKLSQVPGIGKKTADRLILELKGKLSAAPPIAGQAVAAAAPPAPGTKGELLVGALTRMGFRPAEADRAVAGIGARVETEPLGELVREALALLAR